MERRGGCRWSELTGATHCGEDVGGGEDAAQVRTISKSAAQTYPIVTPTTRQRPSSRSRVTVSTVSALLLAKRVRNFTTS
jgi:hypothetical protein